MINYDAWRDRHAALMAISAISEGCRDSMAGERAQVLELVVLWERIWSSIRFFASEFALFLDMSRAQCAEITILLVILKT
jgi:hypothetical protein